jgi:citrate lyase subunit beta/citryl-CoA lyase
VEALVAGTNDLSAELRIPYSPERIGLLHTLSQMVLAARAHGKLAFDGTFTDFKNAEGLRAEARQGKQLGFDGKTLIHPSQIDPANDIFGPSPEDIAQAKGVLSAYESARKGGSAIAVYEGRMIEELHTKHAQALLALARELGLM